jgi:glycerophosphoryl diester phosphodiesterase
VESKSVLIIAHRAGNNLQRAQELSRLGVDCVEADVWLHQDRLELRHSKTLGPIPVLWDRWSLEGPWSKRLTLDTLLSHLSVDVEVMYDIKGTDPLLAARLIETTRRYRPGQRVLVCSQLWSQLAAFLQYPETVLVHSIGDRRQLQSVWPLLERVEHDAVSIHKQLLNPDTIAALKQRVSFIMTWPINDVAAAQQMIDWGVDGLITDTPDHLLTWMGEQGVRARAAASSLVPSLGQNTQS